MRVMHRLEAKFFAELSVLICILIQFFGEFQSHPLGKWHNREDM
jgi:hypothetical protein